MKRTRTKRIAGMMTVALLMTSFLIIGCGDSPTGSITAGEDDGIYVPPNNAGGDPNVVVGGKGSNDMK